MIIPENQIVVHNMHQGKKMVCSNLKSVNINLFHCRRRSFVVQPIASEVISYEVRFHLETDGHCTIHMQHTALAPSSFCDNLNRPLLSSLHNTVYLLDFL